MEDSPPSQPATSPPDTNPTIGDTAGSSGGSSGGAAVAQPESPSAGTRTDTKSSPRTEVPKSWYWNVVLLDDDEHTYDYVVRMVQELFGRNREEAFNIACKVDNDKRVILLTTHREHAELKREQVLAFGRDPLMQVSRGSMMAVLEPAATDA